ncbi:hypothetical protein PHMEG_00015813 [Phytophthora megakarya]|uniref:PX domain-containing protein n=1 Tax=Phytophthora megakarya TaxID=4795 RepID=A0A225W0H6_9STRA|nr:hypothetical protein PHMEG_00015813 [Phytophthora megakarya]
MTDESNQNFVGHHIADSFAQCRPMSFDHTLQNSHGLASQLALPAKMDKRQLSDFNRLSSFGLLAGHEIVDTKVRFLGVVSVGDHCEYPLLIDTGIVKFTLHKRYSQFRALRQLLLGVCDEGKRKCRNGACFQLSQQLARIKFPRRKLRLKVHRDDEVRTAKERSTQLQFFVKTILEVYHTAPKRQVRCCVNSQCMILQSIRSFLDLGSSQMSEWKEFRENSSEIVSPLPSTSISSPPNCFINEAVEGVRKHT